MAELTLVDIYPPVAAATVATTLWCVGAYKLHKRDAASSTESAAQVLWYGGAGAGLLAFLYYHGMKAPLEGYFDFFMAAIVGEMFGILLLFGINMSFFQRNSPTSDRRVWRFYTLVLSALVIGFAFVPISP